MILDALAFTLAAAFGVHGVMMVLAVPTMRAAAASVGFTVRQYRCIGMLELAGAIGVAAGLAMPPIGVAAGAGLFALMLGAVSVHYRNGDAPQRMAPAIGLGLLAAIFVAMRLQ